MPVIHIPCFCVVPMKHRLIMTNMHISFDVFAADSPELMQDPSLFFTQSSWDESISRESRHLSCVLV